MCFHSALEIAGCVFILSAAVKERKILRGTWGEKTLIFVLRLKKKIKE